MRIEIVNGSPRRQGNTVRGLQALEEGIRYIVPDAEIRWMNVRELNLSCCSNCDGCRQNSDRCVVPDDTASAVDRLCQADMILFGSPVYWWGITAQLKMLVDKFYSRQESLAAVRRKIGVLAVGAADLTDPEYELIRRQFDCIAGYLGWDMVLFEAVQAHNPGDLEEEKERLQQLAEAGMRMMRS